MNNSFKKLISVLLLFPFLIVAWPLVGLAQANLGLLHGFVYSDDGKKPLPDAVVLIRENVSQKLYQSEKTKKNGTYDIKNILPGSYSVGIQYKDNDYNVNVFLEIKPKKQMACFTLPKLEGKPSYMIRCKSPKCFFITPVGWALLTGATAALTYGIIELIKVTPHLEVSQTTGT
jgi:hypothetical protein